MRTKPSKFNERTEITEADMPETEDEWVELIHETVEEFIYGTSYNSNKKLHLSPFTFPGGEAEEDDDPTPYCHHGVGGYRRKDAAVFPPHYKEICDVCMERFKHYLKHGKSAKVHPSPGWRSDKTLPEAIAEQLKENTES